MTQATSKPLDLQLLDALTGGAFTAPTSGERAARIRDWLAGNPTPEQLQEVFRELSGRDKGAAKPVREKLDELKRAKGQEALAAEWSTKGQALLESPKLNIADAMAWQRDAAKAGAPLSREPLAGLKTGLADRVRGIEDLQHRVQVQREAAVLLAQRIEVLSTKPWRDAQAALEVLGNDVRHWQAQADAIAADRDWASVDVKFPPQMDASRAQLLVVWDAFQAAVVQTVAAAADATAPLPPVPVWADELRAQRGVPAAASEGAPAPQRPARPKIDPELRAGASQAVREVLAKLEQEITQGHGKASAGAAAALRNALKEHGRLIDDKLENQAHAALAAAGELEGWQRWRADQLRQELVAKAEALLVWPEPRPAKAPRGPKPVRAPRGGAEAVAAAEPVAAESAAPEVAPEAATGDAAVSKAAMSEAAAPETAVAEPAVTDQLAPVSAVPETADMGEQGADAPAPVVASAAHNDSLAASTEAAAEAASPGSTASESTAVATAPTDAPPTTGRAQPQPAMGGRKLQETLRSLREQWKQTDQGGVPNHALWKRFDDACNEAHKFVEIWLDKIKAESAQTRAQRLALIEEVNAFTAANPTAKDGDWKGFNRILHQFSDRWRDAGHLSEKAFAELQPLWKAAMAAAHAPLEAVQKDSIARRHAMIDEAKELGAQPVLRIDAVKSLQQRWQAEAHTVPLDRKFEQKLWDTFRKPIDDAFNRKTAEREKAASELSDRDRAVLDAAKGLEAANASGDAQKIKAALAQLDAAMRGQAQARADMQAAQAAPANPMAANAPAGAPDVAATAPAENASADPENTSNMPDVVANGSSDAIENVATDEVSEAAAGAADGQDAAAPAESAAPATPAKPAPKPVIAMRGDDRPGMKKSAPMQAGRGGKFGDRAGGSRGGPGGGASRPGDNKFEPRRDDRGPRDGARGPGGFGDRGFGDRPAYEDRGPHGSFRDTPRLGDAAFRAQRDAVENAQAALRKLAAQAHGEALTQLLEAWEKRAADQVPGQQELGRAVSPAVRGAWSQSLGAAPAGNAAESASEALLRLEMAAEVPTPAEHISARRTLQLQLLTRRNDPPPAQTWGPDAARVFAAPFDAAQARRLQNALKVLLKR